MIELVQQGLVDHDGRVEAVDGTRAVVEQVGNGIELLLAVDGQVGALGQVLAYQAVSLPATMAKIRVDSPWHWSSAGAR